MDDMRSERPAKEKGETKRLEFRTADQAPAGSRWPPLPDGARFLPVTRGQRMVNPGKNAWRKLFPSGRQRRKARKAFMRAKREHDRQGPPPAES